MSEKRFDFNLGACKIYDKQEERLLEDTEVCGLLNEQQATIEAKNEYQQVLEAKIRRLKNRIKILEKAEGWQN